MLRCSHRSSTFRDAIVCGRRQASQRHLTVLAASLLLLVAVPALAHAQSAHGVIAFGGAGERESVAFGFAWNYASREEAREAAMQACVAGGGTDCVELAWFQNGCGALAVDHYGTAQGKSGMSQEQAETRALQTCEAAGGTSCTVVGSACASPGAEAGTWSGSESVLALPGEKTSPTAEGTPSMEQPASTDTALEEALTRKQRVQVQQGLAALGFNVGPADGMFGPRTRSAIWEWQSAKGLDTTGYLTAEEAAALTALGEDAGKDIAEYEAATGKEKNPRESVAVEPNPSGSQNQVLHYPQCGSEMFGECWIYLSNQSDCALWTDGWLVYTPDRSMSVELTWSGPCLHNAAHGTGTLRAEYTYHEGDGSEDAVEAKGKLVQGKAHGHWNMRHLWSDGHVQSNEGPYVDGKRHGLWVNRKANGNIWHQEHWVNGAPQGD